MITKNLLLAMGVILLVTNILAAQFFVSWRGIGGAEACKPPVPKRRASL